MFSIICVYNNRKILDKYLMAGLNRQDVPYELILIDNTCQTHSSAAKTFNNAARNAAGDLLMFVHQDVELLLEKWLSEVEQTIKGLDDLGTAGVAGRSLEGIYSNLLHGEPPAAPDGHRLSKPTSVQTLDGCMIIIPRSIFSVLPFDEETLVGWYLYAADYCLDINGTGGKNYVLTQKVFHLSMGPSLGKSYIEALRRIVCKHKSHVKTIYTTTGVWRTSALTLQIMVKRLRRLLSNPHKNNQYIKRRTS